MNPLIKSLKKLGGSGTITEINEKVFEIIWNAFSNLFKTNYQPQIHQTIY
jgi:hypothetical protein